MKQNEIETAVAKHLLAMPDAWETQISDQDFKPKPNEPYQVVNVIYGKPDPISSGAGLFSRQTNIIQIDLFFPQKRNSPDDLDVYAEKVRRWFWQDDTGFELPVVGETSCLVTRLPHIRKNPAKVPFISRSVDVYFDVEDGTQ